MLKVRVIPTLLFKSMGLVKGVGFNSWRRTGDALQAIRVYNMREVDEIVFMDISATPEMSEPDYAIIDALADECFMPMTVGGGLRDVDSIRKMLSVGADKVLINTAAFENPELIRDGASTFGTQCIVVGIDVQQCNNGTWEVVTHCGTKAQQRDPVSWARQAQDLGAGELIITSVERDGTMDGYAIEITRKIADAVSIPVIASGGAGNYQHMVDVLQRGNVDAVAAASIYHFTEQTPREAKRYLRDHGIKV